MEVICTARRLAVAAVVLAVLVTACAPSTPPRPSSSVPPGIHGQVFDVTKYGALGDGHTEDTVAFSNAIAAAQNAGAGTVYVPAGTYVFSAGGTANSGSVAIVGSVPITFEGAGRDVTSLVEEHPNKNLLEVRVDGTIVEDLTLDTQSHEGGAAISVQANHTSLLNAKVLGGPKHFAIYYTGPKAAVATSPTYNVGNTVDNLMLNDLDCNDGFSWSYQDESTISNVTHTGSRLALYIDESTSVTNYDYTPGPQDCGARNGFWLTPPASNVTIINFVSSGEGGKIGVISPAHVGRVAVNVTIRGLTMTGSGAQVVIGDVRNLVLEGCNLGDNEIVVAAQAVAQGTISNCKYSQLIRDSAPAAQISITASPT